MKGTDHNNEPLCSLVIIANEAKPIFTDGVWNGVAPHPQVLVKSGYSGRVC